MGSGASKNKKRDQQSDEGSPEAQQPQVEESEQQQQEEPEAVDDAANDQVPAAAEGEPPASPADGGEEGSAENEKGQEEKETAEEAGMAKRGRTPELKSTTQRDRSPFARKQFFYNKGRERLGPVKWSELQERFQSGELHSKSLVWYKALGQQFVFLKDHPELLEALRRATKEERPAEEEDGGGAKLGGEEEDKDKAEVRKKREELLAAHEQNAAEEKDTEEKSKTPELEDLYATGRHPEDAEPVSKADDSIPQPRDAQPPSEVALPAQPEATPSMGAELRRRSPMSPGDTGSLKQLSDTRRRSLTPDGRRRSTQSPLQSPLGVALAGSRRSSRTSDAGAEIWQRVRAWHRRRSSQFSRSRSDAVDPGSAMGRWLAALDNIQQHTPEEQNERNAKHAQSLEVEARLEAKIKELEEVMAVQETALEAAEQAIEEKERKVQELEAEVRGLEGRLTEQARQLEKAKTKEASTQIPVTREAAEGGGEQEQEGQGEEDENEADLAKRKLLPREVVAIAQRVEFVLSHTQMELLEVLEQYDQDGSGMITELAFERALSNKPLALGLPRWQMQQLWQMVGMGLFSRTKQKKGVPAATLQLASFAGAQPMVVMSATAEAGEEEEALPHAFDVGRVAKAMMVEEGEGPSEAVRVLRQRLLELHIRVLPLLNQVDPDGSGAISFFAFKRAFGVGGLSNVNLSEARLRRIWHFLNSEGVGWVDAREAAFVLEPPGSSYGGDNEVALSPMEELIRERDRLLELQRAERHRLFQYEECLAIAVRRLKIMDREWGTKFGQGLLGPISEAGRLGTPTKGRGVLTYFAGGDELHKDTLAISVAPLVLEEAIFQLDAYNMRLKQARGPKKKDKKDGQELLDRTRREALRAASFIVDGLFLRALPKPAKVMTQVRIYLSAHADDFPDERTGLNSMNAFQELKRFLQQRGLHPVLIDLRPGRKETAPSHTAMDLQVLFNEIRSSWAFIAMLGPNYGAQVSPQAASGLAAKKGLAWAEGLAGRSLTEVEITTAFRHIYSDDDAFLRHALIYIRSDATEDGSSESELRWVRQRQLLEDVQQHREYHCRGYSATGELVRSASVELARYARDDWGEYFDDGADMRVPPPFWRGETQAAVRAGLHRSYVPREKEEETLNKYLMLDPELPPMVVVGGSGSGKSALLRGWSARLQDRGSSQVATILSYFGTDSYEPQPTTALLQIMSEMKHLRCLAPSDHVRAMASQSIRHTRLRDMQAHHRDALGGHVDLQGGESVLYGRTLPLDPEEVLEQFPLWCEIAGTRRQIVLILDCMEKLSAPAAIAPWQRPQDLGWLPQKRVHTRVILGLRVEQGGMIAPDGPGGDEALRSLQCFRRWNWPILDVPDVTIEEREALARSILEGRMEVDLKLDQDLQGSAGALGIFYSLCLWANDVTLDITSASQTVHQLCDWALLAWEGACSDESPGLLACAFRMLYVARHGLSYSELTDLVRGGKGAVSSVGIARFFYVTQGAMAPMSERHHLVLRPMREAVQRAYLPSPSHEAAARLSLSAFFANPDGGHSLERIAGEYPWQLFHVGSWEMLRDCITAMPVFSTLWSQPEGVADLTTYWSTSALQPRYDPVREMHRRLDTFLGSGAGSQLRKGEQLEYIAAVARFLHLLRKLEAAEVQYVRAVSMASDIYGGAHSRTITAVREYASVLHDEQRWDEGFAEVEKALEMCEELPLLYVRIHQGGLRGQGVGEASAQDNIHNQRPDIAGLAAAASGAPGLGGFQVEVAVSAIGRREGEAVNNPLHGGVSAGPLIIALRGRESEEASACWELKGRLTRGLGRYDDAVGCFQKAVVLNELYYYLEMWNNTLQKKGSLNPSLAIQLISFSRALYRQGLEEREAECEAMLLHAQHVLEDSLGPKHPDVATHALQAQAELYGQGMGRWVEARDALKKASRILEAALGKEHEKTKRAKTDAADAEANMLQSRAHRHQPAPVSSIGLF